MGTAALDLFSSKKFIVFIGSLVFYGLGRFGLSVDPEMLDRMLEMAAVYIGAQGIADHGKEAAKIGRPLPGQVLETSTTTVAAASVPDASVTTPPAP